VGCSWFEATSPGWVFQHGFQLAHPVDYLRFQRRQARKDFAWRAVRDFGMDDFLVAIVLLVGVEVIEPLQEVQVDDLLDLFEWIGYPAGPEGVPDSVNLVANIAGEDPAIGPRAIKGPQVWGGEREENGDS